MTAAVLLFLILAVCGGGAALLAALGLSARLGRFEFLGWAFALGYGLLGWVMFPLAALGWLAPWQIAATCAVGLAGLPLLRRGGLAAPHAGGAPHADGAPWWRVAPLLLLLAGLMALDGIEALAPPADADSLAYHYALPRRMLEAGHLLFVERALDAASPQLTQMTLAAALALGGERAMTLWSMVSGWGIGLLVFGLARRHLPLDWSLALAAATLSLPAMLYAGGTGQVEPRTAMFLLVAAVASGRATRHDSVAWALAAALAAGFFAASKYTGLLPATVCFVILAARTRHWRPLAAYAAAGLAAAWQWYGWNWWNTGDPIFPMLFGHLPYAPGTAWSAEQARYMAESLMPMELGVPRSLGWLFAYPLSATFAGHPAFESGRTGLGPLAVLLAPLALGGAWVHRRRLTAQPLTWALVVVALCYLLWFFLGPSQRVRHLLPLVPVLLVVLAVAAHRLAATVSLGGATWAALAFALAVQAAGQGVFALKFVRPLLAGGDRDSFLAANVNYYELAQWLNHDLGPATKILLPVREIDYLVTRPIFHANRYVQSVVDLRPEADDPERFLRQLRRQNIDVVVAGPASGFAGGGETPERLSRALVAAGCASGPQEVVTASAIPSRTLGGRTTEKDRFHIYRISHEPCFLDRPAAG